MVNPSLPYVNSLVVGGTIIIDGAYPAQLNGTWTIVGMNGNTIDLLVPLNTVPAITVTPNVSGATVTS